MTVPGVFGGLPPFLMLAAIEWKCCVSMYLQLKLPSRRWTRSLQADGRKYTAQISAEKRASVKP